MFRAFLAAFLILCASTAQAGGVPESFADLAAKLSPSVVNISTTQKVKGALGPGFNFEFKGDPGSEDQMDPFKEFFEQFKGKGEEVERDVYALGSGFIIDPSGYVVTNNHVIAEASEIKVILSDNTTLTAKLIGHDTKTDLALLKVEPKNPLPAVSFGNSDTLRVGDWILAIGNPFGLGGTVTAGIISARARHLDAGPFDDFLQTDAAINRGNSGGPMFNMQGEVVGVNSAIFSPTGSNIGIGFAVPSSLAKPVIEQLKQHGRTFRGWLGVKIQTVTDEIADSLGLPDTKGALVMEVSKDGPGEKAGIKAGDLITKFDGHEIKEMRELPRFVADTAIGKQVEVEVLRGGKPLTLSVKLGELKEDETAEEKTDAPKVFKGGAASEEVLGMSLAVVTEELRSLYNLDAQATGLVVTAVKADSEAAKRGMREGVVITRVNDAEVKTVIDFKNAITKAKNAGRKFALLRVQVGEDMEFVTLPTGDK